MNRPALFLSFVLVATPALAQDVPSVAPDPVVAPVGADFAMPVVAGTANGSGDSGFLRGDRAFPNFIGWVSNPMKAIDPRSLTQMWPVFGSTWTDKIGPLPGGDMQVYGPGISVALTERLEIGLNQGGYLVSHFDKNREGWLDLGGFVQYTLIRDIPHQFIMSGGLSWVFPSGESDVFQGHGPVKMSTWLTGGKEIGNFHVLATNGFSYPIGPGKDTSVLFYGSLHLDRRTFGWLYPLVEFNYGSTVTSPTLDIPAPHDFLTVGGVNPSISLITVAPGANVVLIPNRLEIGVAYQTPIGSQHDFRFNEVLVKMVIRY